MAAFYSGAIEGSRTYTGTGLALGVGTLALSTLVGVAIKYFSAPLIDTEVLDEGAVAENREVLNEYDLQKKAVDERNAEPQRILREANAEIGFSETE